jgi:hypothetical protein
MVARRISSADGADLLPSNDRNENCAQCQIL